MLSILHVFTIRERKPKCFAILYILRKKNEYKRLSFYFYILNFKLTVSAFPILRNRRTWVLSKEISIKSDNVSQFIDYNGSVNNPDKETLISLNLLTANKIPLVPAISFSHNARIVSQNLSINAGDVLGGQVTLREIIL